MPVIRLEPQLHLDPAQPVRSTAEILTQDYLHAGGLTIAALSYRSRIPRRQLIEISQGKRRVSPEYALRLAVALNTSVLYWLLLQAHEDLRKLLCAHGYTGPFGA